MTATYQPFTPANSPQPGGYEGRRRVSGYDGYDDYGPAPVYSPPPQAFSPPPQAFSPPPPVFAAPPQEEFAVAPVPRKKRRVAAVVAVVLAVVAGFQAYEIQGMRSHDTKLAADLTTQKDRTDQLEQRLSGVFDPEAVSSGVLPSVFRVRAGDFTGTAWSIESKAPAGQSNMLTNYHVVAELYTAGGRNVTLERGADKIPATILKVNKGQDLALLRVSKQIPGLKTAKDQVKPGQQVVVVGAPLGLDDSVTSGVVSAYRPDDQEGPTIQFDAPINPGNSGGPVVNSTGLVVGLATAKAKDAEGIGLAIPVKTACTAFALC